MTPSYITMDLRPMPIDTTSPEVRGLERRLNRLERKFVDLTEKIESILGDMSKKIDANSNDRGQLALALDSKLEANFSKAMTTLSSKIENAYEANMKYSTIGEIEQYMYDQAGEYLRGKEPKTRGAMVMSSPGSSYGIYRPGGSYRSTRPNF